MERIKEELQELKRSKEHHLKSLKTIEDKILKLESLKEVSTTQLMKDISLAIENNLKSGNIYFILKKGKYNYILGGDGRSQPWDELRDGIICEVKTIYYLDNTQKELIQSYLKSIKKIDKFNFE